MLRGLGSAVVLLLVLGCSFHQVWVREDGQNIRGDERLTQRFLRDNASCEARAARSVRESTGQTVVLGRDTEYGGYGGVILEDEDEMEREREMQRMSAYRACMQDEGYAQISAQEADEKFGKQPEGFEGNF